MLKSKTSHTQNGTPDNNSNASAKNTYNIYLIICNNDNGFCFMAVIAAIDVIVRVVVIVAVISMVVFGASGEAVSCHCSYSNSNDENTPANLF